MSLNVGSIDVQPQDVGNNGTTTDTTPLVLGAFAVPPNTSILAEVWVQARNPSTGAAKSWREVIAAKRTGSGAVVLMGSQNTAAMVAAGDATAMTACSIAASVDATSVGVQVTGPAATTINWTVGVVGDMLTD
jgi:hypothetical protein